MIAIGSDHGGFELKEEIKKYFDEKEIQYKDFGAYSKDRVDYPIIAKQVAKAVQNKDADRGILICRSGYGMAMVANKFKGIRSAPCFCEEAAKFSRLHNDTNVLALGADYITTGEAIAIVRMWIGTEFEGGRHKERLDMVAEIEDENMKQNICKGRTTLSALYVYYKKNRKRLRHENNLSIKFSKKKRTIAENQ